MLIQVNTDNQTQGTADLQRSVEAVIEDRLGRFADRITRAEVHLTDENGTGKSGGNDKRCLIEIRLAGKDPISATDYGASHDIALRGATAKMQSQLETIVGKIGRG
ncbi:MAG: HPF/RaiA family ribosome-associated protein [Phycisphaeraceae bacterium]|nr:HPF/RaiA family ribosome-associated protein [Phycisphaeraceae bacterium]MBX3366393.1 HPF/RaiA family ribosome-associated protein [Phycisphaeraceae bacterium]